MLVKYQVASIKYQDITQNDFYLRYRCLIIKVLILDTSYLILVKLLIFVV